MIQTSNIEIGQKFTTFYGNGQMAGSVIISRITDASIFVISEKTGSEHREGMNSVKKYILKGLWK